MQNIQDILNYIVIDNYNLDMELLDELINVDY